MFCTQEMFSDSDLCTNISSICPDLTLRDPIFTMQTSKSINILSKTMVKIFETSSIIDKIFILGGCLQNFLLLFMSLLKALILKNSHILAAIFFTFKKSSWIKLERFSVPNLDLTEKIGKLVIK